MCIAVRESCLCCESALSGPWTRKVIYKHVINLELICTFSIFVPFVIICVKVLFVWFLEVSLGTVRSDFWVNWLRCPLLRRLATVLNASTC